jgi:hypothetical protein
VLNYGFVTRNDLGSQAIQAYPGKSDQVEIIVQNFSCPLAEQAADDVGSLLCCAIVSVSLIIDVLYPQAFLISANPYHHITL